MNIQIIERDGRPEYAVVPIAEYRRLVEAAEMLRDIEDCDRAKARLMGGEEEVVPADVVGGLADGEHPLEVWREHRGMTQAELASTAGIGQPYVAMLERGGRRGSIRRLQALARASSNVPLGPAPEISDGPHASFSCRAGSLTGKRSHQGASRARVSRRAGRTVIGYRDSLCRIRGMVGRRMR